VTRLARLVWIWLLIFLLAAAAAWLADNPGKVEIVWLGYRADTSMAILLVLLFAAAMIFVWFDRLRRFTSRRLEALYHYGQRLRARRAQDALVLGLVAAASGDAEGAKRQLARAEKGEPDPRLLLLLRAQAARLSGDRLAAEDAFTAMLGSTDTQSLGLSGLMAEARARGDDDRLRELTEKAHGVVLRARGLFEAAFEGEALAGRWAQALRLVRGAQRHGVIGRQAAARMRTVLLTAEARKLRAQGEVRKARALLRRALDLDPGFTPAVNLAADIEKGRGKRRRALRLIETAWPEAPHPDLGRLYAELAKDREPEPLLAHVRALAGLRPGDPESRLLVAQHAVAAGRIAAAEDALTPMLTPEPSARVCNALAEAARAAHGRAAGQPVEAWLTRAARAPRDGMWRCKTCGRETVSWEPLCSRCGSFDGVRWVSGVEAATGPVKALEAAPAAEKPGKPLSVPAAAGPPPGGPARRRPPASGSVSAGPLSPAAHSAEGAARAGAAARTPGMRGPVNPAIHIPPRMPDDPGPDSDDDRVTW
jgi:HemY protein